MMQPLEIVKVNFDPNLVQDLPGSAPQHIWICGPTDVIPHCRYCETNTLAAQAAQPETKGSGPCPKRKPNGD